MIALPFGLNLLVINSLVKDVPMNAAFKGVAGLVAADILRTMLLTPAPVLSFWLSGLWRMRR